jgi:hypothetical protein
MKPCHALKVIVLACFVCGFGLAPARVHGRPPTQGKPASEKGTQAKKSYQPEIGQEGKDVVWVPTADTMVEQMLDMAKVGPSDFVIDLGSRATAGR